MKLPLICISSTIATLLAVPYTLLADEASAENKVTATTKPMVKHLENGNYQIGKITFNKITRTINMPARINLVNPDTLIEYLIVHLNGEKTHESLLTSEVDPTHLNIALKLLSYQESQELFRTFNEDGSLSAKYHEVSDEIKKSARFEIHVTWKDKEEEKTHPITHWLHHRDNKQKMPDTPWVYNGSYVHNKKFKAKLTGSMFTIFPDLGAIANYPGDDREDDQLWTPAPNLPAERSDVTVTLKPWGK